MTVAGVARSESRPKKNRINVYTYKTLHVFSMPHVSRVPAAVWPLPVACALLSQVAGRACGVLSGGQKKKVSIARALLLDPSVLFLDEPLSGLDSSSAISVCHVLRRLAAKGRAVCLVVHHPLPEVLETADLLWLVVDGRTAYYGALDDSLCAHFRALAYRDPAAARLRTLSEALNFVTLKPAVWDAVSYNAALALEFIDPQVCLRGGAAGLSGRGALEGGEPPPTPPAPPQGGQPMPSHCPPDAKCQPQWHL